MGSVFEAENTWTKRRVALKLLGPELSKAPDRARRFLREAQSTTRIEHPNIVEVLDMGQDEPTGAMFIVQELLRGKDLRTHLSDTAGRRLGAIEALQILVPIMEALEAAHQFGVVHRDVKPDNIFLAREGNRTVSKLIDFGLSKVFAGPQPASAPVTGGGVPVGTPQYMSPEQARGEAQIDGRSDVWSLGVVLYEVLTGTLPFEAPSLPALLMRIATERPRPVDELADVPTEVATLVHTALEPDRERRYGSMTDLLHAVRETSLYEQLPMFVATGHGFRSSVMRVAASAEPRPLDLAWLPTRPPPPPPAPRTPAPRETRGGRLRFGMVLGGSGAIRALDGLATALGPRWALSRAASYAELVDALAEGDLDLAWLPPVAYVRAVRSGACRLLLTLERDGRRSYSAAIVARTTDAELGLRAFEGRRAVWVDPWSAAGYLIPRCMLRLAGIEPDRVLTSQAFVGSYEAVLRSIAEGGADVGAVHCRLDEERGVVASPFRDDPRLRAIAVSREPIPGDTICAPATANPERVRRVVARFVEAATRIEARPVFQRIFGTDRFVAANPSRYEGLEAALAEDVGHER